MEKFKSGFVSIIGRTNVGKSTLINNLVGEKVAITANKNQTTRTAIKAIVNRENSQIIFIDTPGIHKPRTKLGETMNETAWGTIPETDITLFIVEATSSKIEKGDSLILEKLKEKKTKTILLINKIDLIEKEKLLKLIAETLLEEETITKEQIDSLVEHGKLIKEDVTEETTETTTEHKTKKESKKNNEIKKDEK